MSDAPLPADQDPSRRPLKTRSKRWAQALARLLLKCGLQPNTISVLSVVAAFTGSAGYLCIAHGPDEWVQRLCFVVAAVGIQLRLLCNMLDGMVAIEGGKKTVTGDLFNEIPDRIADIAIIACAGYVASSRCPIDGVLLGWLAAALSVMTAYIRALGASLGTVHFFQGPMAKPHRMFTLTVASISAAIFIEHSALIMFYALAILNIGILITLWRRTSRIRTALYEQKATSA